MSAVHFTPSVGGIDARPARRVEEFLLLIKSSIHARCTSSAVQKQFAIKSWIYRFCRWISETIWENAELVKESRVNSGSL